MATLRIKIEGELGAITLRGFLAMAENAVGMLRDYDAALSGEPKGSVDWVVTDLETGSLCIVAESRSRVPDKNLGPDVAMHFVKGWRLIEGEGVTPPHLSEAGMKRARKIVRLIGREGTTGLEVSSLDDKTEISVRSVTHIDRLLQVQHKAIGSVEGRIETVSIHGQSRFIIYHSRTQKAVTCVVPQDKLATLVPSTDMMGKRVAVFGIIHSNFKGEPLRIDAERIKAFRPESELPARASLRGSDPDFTGEMSTHEYVRRIRNG